MDSILEIWSLVVILLCAFVIGWAAEAAQTFIPRALALSILAWLQTLPEFAVEAAIAWRQEQDLMIANLTGSLRLLVGLGWPLIFFVHFFFQGIQKKRFIKEIKLEDEDFIGVLFLFLSILYFVVILYKSSLTVVDSIFLSAIYFTYLWLSTKMPTHEVEDEDDLPWVARKIVAVPGNGRVIVTVFLFALGGLGLYLSVHPFIDTLMKWSISLGVSTFVFVQWVAPFLSEFPEKVTAFNWARQVKKAPMALMNMVNSNINQWTMLAAMIPIVYSLSIGAATPVRLDHMHEMELMLTVAQSFLGGILLLDLKFSILDATIIFLLWVLQFIYAPLREEIMIAYFIWAAIEIVGIVYRYTTTKHVPRAFTAWKEFRQAVTR